LLLGFAPDCFDFCIALGCGFDFFSTDLAAMALLPQQPGGRPFGWF